MLVSSLRYHKLGVQQAASKSDMVGSLSGGSSGGGSSTCFDIDICPDLILAGLATFAAVAFFMIYQAITMAAVAPRKRRRSLTKVEERPAEDKMSLIDQFWLGTFHII